MGIFSRDNDDPSTGSGKGGTLGPPGTDNVEDVPSNDDANMVVSGGGAADASADDASLRVNAGWVDVA